MALIETIKQKSCYRYLFYKSHMLTNGYRKYFSHKIAKCRHGWALCDHFLCYFARSFFDELSNLPPASVQSSRICRDILGDNNYSSLTP